MKLICKEHKQKMILVDDWYTIYKCPICDAAIRYDEDDEEYLYVDDISFFDDLYEGMFGNGGSDYIPEGCAACGGDYPNCKSGCPMFDI